MINNVMDRLSFDMLDDSEAEVRDKFSAIARLILEYVRDNQEAEHLLVNLAYVRDELLQWPIKG